MKQQQEKVGHGTDGVLAKSGTAGLKHSTGTEEPVSEKDEVKKAESDLRSTVKNKGSFRKKFLL